MEASADTHPLQKLRYFRRLALGVPIAAVVLAIGFGYAPVRKLLALQRDFDSRWAELYTLCQRRTEITRSIVPIVSAADDIDQSLVADLVKAQAGLDQCRLNPSRAPRDPVEYASFAQGQSALYKALSQVLSRSIQSPKLKADRQFRDLVAQLLLVDNKLVLDQGRFVQTGIAYNNVLSNRPANIYGLLFGLQSRAYLAASANSKIEPL